MATEALAVVVVSYNSADHLPSLLGVLSGQLGQDDELVVVDNGSRDASAELARQAGDRITVIETEANLGFGGGCHVGAGATRAPLLLFINPDSVPEEGFVDRLRAASREHPEWGAWQAAVLMPDGTINTDGGVVHFLGMGWAGDCGRPAADLPAETREPGFPSGAAMVVRRSTWDRLGGLDASYFMYCEDLDLGLRVWLSGERVGMVPEARVIHAYEFDKGSAKWFWLERNRLRTVASVYPASLLLLLAPALLAAELALIGVAAADGWLLAKLRAQCAVLRGVRETLDRRRSIQATRRLTAAEFAGHLTASLDSAYVPVSDAGAVARLLAGYWILVQRALRLLDFRR